MTKKLLHGFPETNKMIEKINKDILGLFKDHVEWQKYEKSVVYPFWKNLKGSSVESDEEFRAWSEKMKKQLMQKGKDPKVKPKVDFDTSGVVITKNDFSKLATTSYLVESLEKGIKALKESVDGGYDKEKFNASVNIILENFKEMTSGPKEQDDSVNVNEAIRGIEDEFTGDDRADSDSNPSLNRIKRDIANSDGDTTEILNALESKDGYLLIEDKYYNRYNLILHTNDINEMKKEILKQTMKVSFLTSLHLFKDGKPIKFELDVKIF